MADLELLEALVPKQIWDGACARVVEGERITLAVVELDPGAVVPQHRHDNEQLGLVIHSPPRADWKDVQAAPARETRWPG
jgi:quercetin dioxygenase-like cupin family protein